MLPCSGQSRPRTSLGLCRGPAPEQAEVVLAPAIWKELPTLAPWLGGQCLHHETEQSLKISRQNLIQAE